MKIVELKTERDEYQSSVVETCEKALEMAKSGDIAAIAFAYVRKNEAIGCGFSEGDRVGALIGAVTRLGYRINESAA